jgi:serine/threonine-protein kinase
MTHPTTSLSAGDVLAGKYVIEQVIGEGGMGKVLAGRRIDDGRLCAIKCLLPAHRDNPDIVARFQREARATSRLTSEHVTRVLESGEIHGEGGAPPTFYLVMEHLEGYDLKTLLQRKGRFSAARAAGYVSQACLALAEAHALGIVHRDLKPANLFRTTQGVVKVIDFGIAKFTSSNVTGDRAEMTEGAIMMGSMPFMAPEQVLDARSVDGRADLWSLGVVLYQLVSGEKPFVGDDPSEQAFNLLTGAPRPLGDLCPTLPRGFEAVVMRCLEKRRDLRYPSAAELARALAPFAERRPTSRPGEQLIHRTLPLDPETVHRALAAARDSDPSVDEIDGPPTRRLGAA